MSDPSAPPPGYGAPPYAYESPQKANGLAIASLVLGIIWVYWLGSVLAIVFGFIALKQINESNGAQSGRGMAIAGIVLGLIGVAILALVIILVVAIDSTSPTTSIGLSPLR